MYSINTRVVVKHKKWCHFQFYFILVRYFTLLHDKQRNSWWKFVESTQRFDRKSLQVALFTFNYSRGTLIYSLTTCCNGMVVVSQDGTLREKDNFCDYYSNSQVNGVTTVTMFIEIIFPIVWYQSKSWLLNVFELTLWISNYIMITLL